MKFRHSISLVILLGAGCVHYQPQPVSPTKTAEELESRSLTNAALKVFIAKNLHRELTDWPKAPWDFEMLTLAAFYYHPDLALARAQWNVAQAGIKTAGGRPNPTLSLAPGYDTTHSGLSPWFPMVSFDLPLETAGKRGHRIQAAEQLSEAARLNVATAAWQIRGNLRSSLIDLEAERRRAQLLRNQLSLQEQIVRSVEQQVQAGASANSEAAQPRIALQKLRLDLSEVERSLAEAQTRVAQAIGVSSAALDQVKLSGEWFTEFHSASDLPTTQVRRTALLSRADILAALVEYAAAQAALQTEIAKQYPDVHLNPGYQFDQGDNKWSLGITFELPVLNQNQGPIAEAAARRAEAAAKFNVVQAKALGEIERAVAVFNVRQKNSTASQSLAQAQAALRDSVEGQFKAGAINRFEWLSAQSEFVSSQLTQLDSEVKLQQAAAQLEDAIQQPLEILSAAMPATAAKQEKP